jgi:hypothetical protein
MLKVEIQKTKSIKKIRKKTRISRINLYQTCGQGHETLQSHKKIN